MSKASCAVVGLGQGLEDLYCAVNHPRFDVRAVCDIDPATHEWITGKRTVTESERPAHHVNWVREVSTSPDAKAIDYVPEYARLLERDDIQAVILVVPDALHEPYAVQALQAGKYVLCTKPMSLTVEESLRLGEVARAHPGHYMLGFQLTYSPFAQILLDTVDSGLLGPVRQIRFDYHRKPWRPMHSTKNARVDGAIIKEGTHWLDMIHRIAGRRAWRSVSAFGAIDVLGDRVEFEDNGVLILDYDGFRAAHTFSYFRESRPTEDFLMVGEKGTVRGTFRTLHIETDDVERTVEVPGHALPHQFHVGYYEMIDQFARVVLDGEDPYTNWQTGVENMLTCHAAQIAVMEGRTVHRDELKTLDWRVVLE